MPDTLKYSQNGQIHPLSEAYERALGDRIPSTTVQNLAFNSRRDLIEKLFIDSLGNAIPRNLTPQEAEAAYYQQEYLPACLCYRRPEDLGGGIQGGEFLTRRLDPTYGLGGYQHFFHALGQDMRSEIYMQNLELAAMVAGKLPGFYASVNISGSMMERPDFNDRIDAALQDNDLDDQMHLEILEYLPGLSREHIDKLRVAVKSNAQLCLDDCGEGNSAKLLQDCIEHELPVHTLKIDSRIAVSPLEEQVRELSDWLKHGEKANVQSLVFEGDMDALITPRVVDTILNTRDKLGRNDLEWLIEGPVFPNGTTIA